MTSEEADPDLRDDSPQVILKVVLLLFDPESRRFEFFLLGFDFERAFVADVLKQIPGAVTEEALSSLEYVAITDYTGKELHEEVRLSSFCKGGDVLVAVPSGVSGLECLRVSKPILNDPKVMKMFKASNIDASSWLDSNIPSEIQPKEAEVTVAQIEEKIEEKSEIAEKESLLQEEEKDTVVERELVFEEEKLQSKPNRSLCTTFLALVVVVLMAIVLQLYQVNVTSPLKKGQLLAPGSWVSKCGLLSALPACDNDVLQMGYKGDLVYYNGDGQVEWDLRGHVCEEEEEDCVDGLMIREDGVLSIGGKPIGWVSVKKDAHNLAPWPFAETPKLKIVYSRK